jgi:hypothetical protein
MAERGWSSLAGPFHAAMVTVRAKGRRVRMKVAMVSPVGDG